jgi:hypothetical protein
MRKFLGTLLIIALIIAGVGVYRGWFGFSTDDQPNETNVELRIDKERIRQDAEAATEKARRLTSDNNLSSSDPEPSGSETDEPNVDEE